MKTKPFHEISPAEIDQLISKATERAFIDSLSRGLPISGMANGFVVTIAAGDPVFDRFREKLTLINK